MNCNILWLCTYKFCKINPRPSLRRKTSKYGQNQNIRTSTPLRSGVAIEQPSGMNLHQL